METSKIKENVCYHEMMTTDCKQAHQDLYQSTPACFFVL